MHIRCALVFLSFFFIEQYQLHVGEDILQGAGGMQMKTNRIKELLPKAKGV